MDEDAGLGHLDQLSHRLNWSGFQWDSVLLKCSDLTCVLQLLSVHLHIEKLLCSGKCVLTLS